MYHLYVYMAITQTIQDLILIYTQVILLLEFTLI